MEFRYQEVFTWFIPGFFLLFYLLVEAIFLFPGDSNTTGVWDFVNSLKDGSITFLIFAIPFISLIIGGIFNGLGGYAFRHCFKRPIYNVYSKLLNDKKIGKEKDTDLDKRPKKEDYTDNIEEYKNNLKAFKKQAEWYFDDTRDKINPEDIDRFYYRYVYSRNMFITQIFILVATSVMVFFSPELSLCSFAVSFVVALVILVIFGSIVNRDLSTHVKQVLIRRNTQNSVSNNTES
ncbi:MAG: hypothetical protein K2K45_06575 [Muribaculaceae bacterium]|nr:hypothetical protein [Muribaculaceae bacterium]